jgi:hypothetical protein
MCLLLHCRNKKGGKKKNHKQSVNNSTKKTMPSTHAVLAVLNETNHGYCSNHTCFNNLGMVRANRDD